VERIPDFGKKDREDLSCFGKFLAYCCGSNPADHIVPTRYPPYLKDGHMLYEFPFGDVLDMFDLWTHRKSVTDTDRAYFRKHLKENLCILLGEKGWFDIRSYGPSLYQDLKRISRDRGDRFNGRSGTAAGYLCEYLYGENPHESESDPRSVPRQPQPYQAEVEQYRSWLEHNEYRDPESVINTLNAALRNLVRIVGEKPIGEITSDDLRTYRSAMSDSVKERTVKGYMDQIRLFVRTVTGKDLYSDMKIMFNRPMVKRMFLTKEQYRTALSVADPDEKLALVMCATMGLRRNELASIRLDDIDGGYIKVPSRRLDPDSHDYVRLTDPAKDALDDYLKYRDSVISEYGDASECHLFVYRNRYCGKPMTEEGIEKMMQRLSEKAGFRITATNARRLYADTMNKKGVDRNTIQRMMRHQDFDSTVRCYLAVDPCYTDEANDFIDGFLA